MQAALDMSHLVTQPADISSSLAISSASQMHLDTAAASHIDSGAIHAAHMDLGSTLHIGLEPGSALAAEFHTQMHI
jgi:hypothetical protein